MELKALNGMWTRWAVTLVIALAVSSAESATLVRRCRKACADEVAACISAGGRKRQCRKDKIGQCKREGIAVCESANDGGNDGNGNQNPPADDGGSLPPSSDPTALAAATLRGFVPAVGSAKDVAIVGTRAYLASAEFGLSIVDVTTPAAPVALGGATPSFYAERVAVSGTTAVLTGNGLGLKVVDTTDPRAPRVLASMPGTMKGVAMVGTNAYVIQVVPGNPARTDLLAIDLRTPTAPRVAGRVTVAGGSEVRVVGTLVFVPARAAGLQIIDVANPAAPRIIATLDTPGNASGVAVANGWAWVADGNAVVAVDVRTPTRPVRGASLATTATTLACVGSRLYVLDGLKLKVIDVTNPAAPALRSTSDGVGAQGITVVGNTAYLASPDVNAATKRGGLYVVDVTLPTAPRIVTNIYGGHDNWAVGVSGTLGAVAGNGLGLKIVNIANPSAPRVVGSLAGTMKGVAVAGQYAYAIVVVPGNPARIELDTVDLRNPAAPVIVGRVTLPGASGVQVVGSFAYVSAGAAGLEVIDISSPTAPRIVASLDTAGIAWGVSVANGYAYVADETAVRVIDVHTPTKPVLKASVTTPATAITAGGTKLLVIGGLQLKVMDITNPVAPIVRSTSTAYGAQAVQVMGSLAVLATPGINHFDLGGGLYVIDIANPAAPKMVKQLVVPGTTRSLTSANGYVYAGDSAGVIDVLGPM
jgi:hypothetical protein